MYTLLITRSAEGDLRRRARTLFERINARILSLRDEPRPHGVRKLMGASEGWRLRVGDHRILYRIDDDGRTVTIVRIKHRREAYR
jgi:mRNA interferase RelE/StbE